MPHDPIDAAIATAIRSVDKQRAADANAKAEARRLTERARSTDNRVFLTRLCLVLVHTTCKCGSVTRRSTGTFAEYQFANGGLTYCAPNAATLISKPPRAILVRTESVDACEACQSAFLSGR
jgi:hypothetical protein